jgi:hypothetical protein
VYRIGKEHRELFAPRRFGISMCVVLRGDSMPFDDYRYVVEYESAEGDVITRYYRGWQTAYAFIGNYAVWLIRRLSDRVVIAQSRPLGTQTGSTGKQEEAR